MNRLISTKTFIISHFLILLVSLVFLSGIYYLTNSDKFEDSTLKNYQPISTKPISFTLDVANPEDNILTFDKSMLISGSTMPLATIIISSINQDNATQADENGEFSKLFELEAGLNELKISAFDSFGNTDTALKSVYFSAKKLEEEERTE